MITGLHHIAFKAKDYKKTLEFYKALGLKVYREWGDETNGAAMIDMGDGNYIELFGDGDKFNAQGNYRHIAFTVSDCDAVYNKALELGATSYIAPNDIVIPSRPEPIPARIAFVYGFDGEEIEFFQVY